MVKFSHVYTIAFEVKSPHNGDKVTGKELKEALQKRLDNLSEKEMEEACGLPEKTGLAEGTYICPSCEEVRKIASRTIRGCCRRCSGEGA